ncbi:B12 binding protein [Thermosporothrix hazakensis]|jgi:DNA-binding transcriptional MerR regulator|uniref:B12 binding protein n=1 Tax=Thermosporothrix hazakensis TaxID=644383 RepID=A0A326UE51_THEHA|nr:B12-binding domain-containing protein [Thermosporothrix hazakensis]PZW24719.1 B12 binding protein [Thermosporothrix hazakensis]GCE48335.1 hypothetical protein KTH_32040 [Thermosporothrix hazakensis]
MERYTESIHENQIITKSPSLKRVAYHPLKNTRPDQISIVQTPPDDGLPHLDLYSATPCLDLEATVSATGIPAMTLRTWERLYGIPAAWRTSNNYSLYSQRDVAALRWIRKQLTRQISVRQAMVELTQHEPGYAAQKGVHTRLQRALFLPGRELHVLLDPLLQAIAQFDEAGANHLLQEAFDTHPAQRVCQHLLQPVLLKVVEMCHSGVFPKATEVFAAKITRLQVVHLIEAGFSPKAALQHLNDLPGQAEEAYNALRQQQRRHAFHVPELPRIRLLLLEAIQQNDEHHIQNILDEAFFYYSVEEICLHLLHPLLAQQTCLVPFSAILRFAAQHVQPRLLHLLHASTEHRQGPAIFIGRTIYKDDELETLMLALCWQRQRFNVYYPEHIQEGSRLIQTIESVQPEIVYLSASSRTRLRELTATIRDIGKLPPPHPLICFGGRAFQTSPHLARSIKGIFLGVNPLLATEQLQELIKRLTATTTDPL